jgi:hypothetical protein
MGVPAARAQWFGDLVTMGAWGELWLNEGFATYLETLGASAAAPDLALLAGFFPDVTAVGLAADARNLSTHALSQPGGARPGASSGDCCPRGLSCRGCRTTPNCLRSRSRLEQ